MKEKHLRRKKYAFGHNQEKIAKQGTHHDENKKKPRPEQAPRSNALSDICYEDRNDGAAFGRFITDSDGVHPAFVSTAAFI
jgi:hypothetical protein